MRRATVYIACPMTGSGNMHENVQNSILAQRRLIGLGYAPINPALTHYADPDNIIAHDVWMEVDLPIVQSCDAVLRLPGKSKGADIETRHASLNGIPVYNSFEELQENLAPTIDVELPSKPISNGSMTKHSTGAVRSNDADGERWDLISPIGLRRVAATCSEGANKYGDYNWERGFGIAVMLQHMIRHAYLYLAGDRTEDHLGHAAWNALGACHSEEMWPHLNGNLRGPGCTPPVNAEEPPKVLSQ